MRNFKTIGIVFGVLLVVTNAFANEFVSYELAKVVKVDPIGNMKAYSAPRMSCTTVENIVPQGQVNGSPVGQQAAGPQQKCVSYSDREFRYNVIAFNVTFEYRGQIRTVKMDYDPGNTIQIKTVTKVYAVE